MHGLELLGLELRWKGRYKAELLDGEGVGGRLYIQSPWALLALDRWLGRYLDPQVQLVVRDRSSTEELWEWISDAVGVWPIPPLQFTRPASTDSPAKPSVAERSHDFGGVEWPDIAIEPPLDSQPTQSRATKLGDREVRTCWNFTSGHFGQAVPQVLMRSRPKYRLWSCDICKFQAVSPPIK